MLLLDFNWFFVPCSTKSYLLKDQMLVCVVSKSELKHSLNKM